VVASVEVWEPFEVEEPIVPVFPIGALAPKKFEDILKL
jgi:hypothetical protein